MPSTTMKPAATAAIAGASTEGVKLNGNHDRDARGVSVFLASAISWARRCSRMLGSSGGVARRRLGAGQAGTLLELYLFCRRPAIVVGDGVQRDLVEPGGEGVARVGVPFDVFQRFKEHLRRHILCQRLVSHS